MVSPFTKFVNAIKKNYEVEWEIVNDFTELVVALQKEGSKRSGDLSPPLKVIRDILLENALPQLLPFKNHKDTLNKF